MPVARFATLQKMNPICNPCCCANVPHTNGELHHCLFEIVVSTLSLIDTSIAEVGPGLFVVPQLAGQDTIKKNRKDGK